MQAGYCICWLATGLSPRCPVLHVRALPVSDFRLQSRAGTPPRPLRTKEVVRIRNGVRKKRVHGLIAATFGVFRCWIELQQQCVGRCYLKISRYSLECIVTLQAGFANGMTQLGLSTAGVCESDRTCVYIGSRMFSFRIHLINRLRPNIWITVCVIKILVV